MDVVNFILAHGAELVAGVVGVLAALYALFLVIPGDQPDKAIKAILDFTEKFSRK